jgi:hypothetical protein
MTIKQPASLSTDVQATLAAQVAIATQAATAPADAAPSTVQPRPGHVVITDPIDIALGAAAHLIRQGYIFDDLYAPQIYMNTGYATLTLCLGVPNERSIKSASEAMELAEGRRQAELDREMAASVQRLLEQTKRDAEKAVLLAQIAEQEAAIAEQRNALRRLQAQAA